MFMRLVSKFILKSLLFIYCVIFAIETEYDFSTYYPVDISVYNGEGSLLISWSVPDSIKIKKTRLYYKKFGDDDYNLLAEFSTDIFNFLQKDCIQDARYFYKIEIDDIYDNIYYSDLEKPSFGTCLSFKDSIQIDKSIKNIFDLILMHIDREIAHYSSSISFQYLEVLLRSEINNSHNWIENFPLDVIISNGDSHELFNEIILNDNLFNDIMDYENMYRNHLLLDPSKWLLQINQSISKIRNNWELLYREYSNALDFIETMDPIRVLGINVDLELSKPYLKLYLIHPEKINASEWYLLSENEYINLENYSIENGHFISLEIPEDWYHLNLMNGDEIIQSCPIPLNQSVTYTLNGDIIPLSKDNNYIKVMKDSSSLWFNEISWNPIARILSIEIAGMHDLYEEYIVKHNEETIWDLKQNQFGFEMQFLDSSFVINDSLTLPSFLSLQKKNGQDSSIIEYIFLDTSSVFISRVPDNGSWVNSSLTTLGTTNEIVKDRFNSNLMPEFFVLYQNFPNPFNGQTKITFDLLEDAIVTMYISDATGRIHDKIIESKYITSGNYNFLWDGDGRSSGIYFITLQAELEQTLPAIYSRKMIYLK